MLFHGGLIINKLYINNEQVLDRIGEKRTLLNNILLRKANWIGHILRINCLLHDAIEGQMAEMKVNLISFVFTLDASFF